MIHSTYHFSLTRYNNNNSLSNKLLNKKPIYNNKSKKNKLKIIKEENIDFNYNKFNDNDDNSCKKQLFNIYVKFINYCKNIF